MITYTEAMSIAQNHLDTMPLPSSDYVWRLPEAKESQDGWIFEYIYVCLKDIPLDEWKAIGGAPAFFVSKATREVRDLSWEEMG